jgi:protein-disulfide isomerase
MVACALWAERSDWLDTEAYVATKKTKGATAPRNMKPFYLALGVIALLGIGAILYARNNSGEMATDLVDLTQLAEGDSLVDVAQGITIGEANAPVQIIVFSDFMCPGCKAWATSLEPMIKSEFVQTGKVRYTYYDYPLVPGHRFSMLAARAARCAGEQNKFWEYHDMLFGRQEQWSYSAAMPTEQLLQYGTELGLEQGPFESCVRSTKHVDLVSATKKLGDSLGVGGTPTVGINGRKLGDREWNNPVTVRAAIVAAGGA